MKEVESLDDGLVKGWKDDIDTLLVFAGLFSAVVTAFAIESYQWLEEAPEDVNVALLTQIYQRLNNETITPAPQFEVSSSVVRINVLWFLSLIISLVDALFALLCRQWLREHGRHTHTRTPAEALALRWLRMESLEKWHVPTILGSLPVLLQFALFLFLAGVLELLRARHPVPFTIATTVVILAALFYVGTTILPGVDIIRQALQVSPELSEVQAGRSGYSPADFITTLPPMAYICPLKSPQAWAAFQSFKFISRISRPILQALSFLYGRDYISRNVFVHFLKSSIYFDEALSVLSRWSSVDLELLQQYSKVPLAPPFYELGAFRWLVSELRDTPFMIPHLQNILSTIPLHLLMPAVLSQWFFLPSREWTVDDIEVALRPDFSHLGIEDHLSYAKQRFLNEGGVTEIFNQLLHWIHVSVNDDVAKADRDQHSPGSSPVPFHRIDAKLHRDPALQLWQIYTKISRSPAASDAYWLTLVEDLAPYIRTTSPDYALEIPTATTISPFVESESGREFFSEIHTVILKRKLYKHAGFHEVDMHWMEAIDVVRRVHHLPEDYFPAIPGCFPLSLSTVEKTLDDLSPTDSDIDFGYLSSFCKHWGDASPFRKAELVQILSGHINNYAQPDTESNVGTDDSKVSPLVGSTAGLELITFVNDRLAEEENTYRWLPVSEDQVGWRETIERAKKAHPELPSAYFRPILHESSDHSDHPLKDGVHSTGPHVVRNNRENGRDNNQANEVNQGNHDPDASTKDTGEVASVNDKGGILTQVTQISDPERIKDVHDLVEHSMGGPGADEKV
ncbi:hypothetical protein PQX77_021157 [Marasmius sp. AFHP31]|nr:hypothetical protein PQX77_021157 [Marasmius sp. AFHP31]